MQYRKRIYEIVELSGEGNQASTIYDYFMMAVIIISLVPLAFKETNVLFEKIDLTAAIIFILDYLARWITADLKLGKGAISFLRYPFSFMAIVDLISILPTFLPMTAGFRLLKTFRLIRTFRVFRAARMFRYSKSMEIIANVIREQSVPLLAVCTLAGAYVLISALIIFNVEPDTFENFFEAIYWACVSLTTMGYGDIYPVSTAGRVVTMVSSFMGIAIIALPSGILTAGYMDALGKGAEKEKDEYES
ncbi:MAG: ion transporter [Lachnospiraceae bacterium]|nr:ion transporter [Lachnospiraceae bacterium]